MVALYVPPTEESDHKKQNMSIQLIGGQTSTNTTGIATNTANIATNTTNIATNTTNIASNTSAITALQALVPAPKFTNSLSGDVALNSIGAFFVGPTIAQGTSGTWWASGQVTVQDTAGAATMVCKLWDGTTVIASGVASIAAANGRAVVALSGYITSPAGNIRISVADGTSTSGKILFNNSSESKDSTLSAIRIA